MQPIALLATIAAAALTPLVQAQPVLQWSVAPAGRSIATDAAENVFTVNWEYAPAGDITLTKHASTGVVLWQARHDNLDSNRHEVATWVEADSGGNAYVSGTIRSGYSSPVNANGVLMRFAANGALLWRRVLGADFDGGSTVKVLVDASDHAYVLGIGPAPAGGLRASVHKLAPNGDTVWVWHDPVGLGAPVNLKFTGDGSLVLSAMATTGQVGGFSRIGADGQTRWSSPPVPSVTPPDAAGDTAGNLYLTYVEPVSLLGQLRKVGPDNGVLWTRSDSAALRRVEVGPDGQPVVGGYPNTGSVGVVLLKFGPDGTLRWANRDADGPTNALLAHGQMRLDGAGNAYVVGSNMSQIGVTQVPAQGGMGWTLLVPYGYGNGLAFGAAGRVYVTGGQTSRIDTDGSAPPPTDADLAVTLADGPDPVRPGGTLVLTTTVRNLGAAPATQVALVQNLSANVTGVSATTTQGTCTGVRPMSCSLGTLAPGAVATVVQTVRPRTVGTLVTTASVSTATADPVTANNSASASTTVKRR